MVQLYHSLIDYFRESVWSEGMDFQNHRMSVIDITFLSWKKKTKEEMAIDLIKEFNLIVEEKVET